MPRRSLKKLSASFALSKRWTDENVNSAQSKSVGTMTEETPKKKFATQGIQTELSFEENSSDIATAEEIITFTESINQQLAALPVPIGQEDENPPNALSHTITSQLQDILRRYGHDFNQATTKTTQVIDSEFVFTSTDFLEEVMGTQECEKCERKGKLQMTKKENLTGGIVEFELRCRDCMERKTHKTDCRMISSRSRPKSWLGNFVLLSFFLNGEYFKDYQHVLGTLGLNHLSESQWLRAVEWVYPAIRELTVWSCDEVRKEIIKRGDKDNLQITFDGFYLSRGYHSNNSTGTVHDEKSGKVIGFAHRSKRGKGSNWNGTSGGAEGDIFEEILTALKDDKFNINECVIDHDATCANVLLEFFPEAEVIYCGNHTVKTFHNDLINVKKVPCQVRLFLLLIALSFHLP